LFEEILLRVIPWEKGLNPVNPDNQQKSKDDSQNVVNVPSAVSDRKVFGPRFV
jgi:hypothetical protein